MKSVKVKGRFDPFPSVSRPVAGAAIGAGIASPTGVGIPLGALYGATSGAATSMLIQSILELYGKGEVTGELIDKLKNLKESLKDCT